MHFYDNENKKKINIGNVTSYNGIIVKCNICVI